MSQKNANNSPADEHAGLLDKFSPEYHQLVEVGQKIGVENLDIVLSILGGQKTHVPMKKNFYNNLRRQVRDEHIRTAFKGNNYGELALSHGLKERQVREILKGKSKIYKHPVNVNRACKITPDNHDYLQRLSDRYCSAPTHALLSVIIETAERDPALHAELAEKFGEQIMMAS